MSDNVVLLGSVWRDWYGNTYRVRSIKHLDDPEVELVYAPPEHTQRLNFSDLEKSWSLVRERES